MSKLEDLIAELCPNGVEYVKLGKIAPPIRGVRVIRSQLALKGEYPVFQNSMTPLGYYEESNCPSNTAFVISAGAAGEVGYSMVDFWAADDCFYFVCPEQLKSRFLYYALMCQREYLLSRVRRASVPRLARSVIENLKIPLPPLPVQREIVRILDNFTELSAELSAELSVRKKQYEYYRNALLTFDDDCIFKTLGEVCDFVRGPFGGSLKKEIFRKSGYAVYEQQHAIYGEYNFRYFIDEYKFNEMRRFEVKPGDLIMSCSGTMGKISIIPAEAPRGIINQALLKLTAKEDISNKYLKYCFENSISAQMNFDARGGAIKNVASVSVLKDIKIHVPSVLDQERIVAILDHFDALCNDLSSGLPAEIEARRKQYEYYRDKLLTFKEMTV